MEKLKTDSIILNDTRLIDSVYDGYTYFSDGDILMAKVTPCFENKNIAVATGLVNGIGFGSSEIYTIRTKKKINNRFLFYRLQEDGFMDHSIGEMTGAGGLKRVPSETLANYTYANPNEEEAAKIARFLDHETGKIDRLIQKQQQLIELLKEKRQAVISHAVTKGLNPNAPLKPSNIEWLGDVPEHWEVAKIFHLSSRIGDGLHGTPKYEDGTGLYFVNGNNLESGSIVIGGSAKEVPMKDFEAYKVPLSERSVLLSINGTIGKVALYRNETVILGKSAAYINCLPALQPRFLMTFFESNHAKRYYTLVSSGTTISNLSLDAIRQFQICLPSTDEQDAIVNYADEQKEMYATLIASASKMASTLQERRTALISAAVTGKIDVRDWSPAGDESEEEKG